MGDDVEFVKCRLILADSRMRSGVEINEGASPGSYGSIIT